MAGMPSINHLKFAADSEHEAFIGASTGCRFRGSQCCMCPLLTHIQEPLHWPRAERHDSLRLPQPAAALVARLRSRS